MNLLEIICTYLEKHERNYIEGEKFLLEMVEGADMPMELVKHVKGCVGSTSVTHVGNFMKHKNGTGKLQDVNVWTVQVKT